MATGSLQEGLAVEPGGAAARKPRAARMRRPLRSLIVRDRLLYALVLPLLVYFVVFSYVPMAGLVIAFQDYKLFLGVLKSPWVGLKHFVGFFGSPYAYRTIRNTLALNFYLILFGFPAPIVLALMLNELRSESFKRVVQTVSYLPHFISTVVLVGIAVNMLSPSVGIVNRLIGLAGSKPIYFLTEPRWFRTVYVCLDIWKGVGWGSIIYLAALAGIDPNLYEAAKVDGANRWRQIVHINIPGIAPTIAMLFILRMGGIMSVGFEQVFLLYNPLVYETADVIATYVYRLGLSGQQGPVDFSFATAVGLFESVVGLIFLVGANRLSRRYLEHSLW